MMYPLDHWLTIQTFADHENATGYPTIKNGHWGEIKNWIEEENNKGMGIFYAVNVMRDTQRSAHACFAARAHYIDIDGIPNDLEKDLKSEELLCSSLPPSSIVYTRNGVQALWPIYELPPNPDYYKTVQEGIIARFKGDPGAKDIARVLRMPGTYHLKNPDNPYMCTVMYIDDDAIYEQEDLKKHYPAPPPARTYRSITLDASQKQGTLTEWGNLMREYAAWPGSMGYRHTSLLIAAGNAVRCGISEKQAISDLYPIMLNYRGEERKAIAEVLSAVRFAYKQGEPYSARALLNIIRAW